MHHHRKQQGLVDNDQDELPVLAGITVLPPVFLCSVEAPSMSAQKNLSHIFFDNNFLFFVTVTATLDDSRRSSIKILKEDHICKPMLLPNYKGTMHI
jgi:hypothetical protein